MNMNIADALFMAWIVGMWHIAVFLAGYIAGQAQPQAAQDEKGVGDVHG